MKKIDIKKYKYPIALGAFWLCGFLAVAICYLVLHVPVKQELARLEREINESRDILVIANRATQPDMQQEARQRLKQTQATLRQFSVPRRKVTGLVFEIGKIANELEISEFASSNRTNREISTVRKSPVVDEDWLNVEFSAPFGALARFVNRLERQHPTVFVERMTLQRSDDQQRDHDVTMELSFLVTHDEDPSVALADESSDRVQ